MPIYNKGRYRKRGTNEDNGPMVCKGYAPLANKQSCLDDILPRALLHFELLPDDYVLESTSSNQGGSARRSRISADLPEVIDRESVLEAINRIDTHGIAPHGKNHTFELLHDSKGYPPLAVLAFALEHQQGEVVSSRHITRGRQQSRVQAAARCWVFNLTNLQRGPH